jgi:hypothetical protein
MTTKPTPQNDAKLVAELEAAGLVDPRAAYRERLRMLRELNPAAFEEALRLHEAVVARAGAESALAAWIDFGCRLGELTSPGVTVQIDEAGRSSPFASGVTGLVVHLPEDAGAPAMAVAVPSRPTPAQQASLDLLVGKKLALGT